MGNKKTIKNILLDRVWVLLQHALSDKQYLSLKYWVVFRKRLHWENPQTYSEKLQWLKLYGCQPEYSDYVDKIKVKDYVRSIIGDEYVIPTLGVWKSSDEINFEDLPNKFVLKCNHDSGQVIICKNKQKLNLDKTKAVMSLYLRSDYYLMGRETPYKHVEKRIFAEKFMEDENTKELRDYKFFCFHGEPKLMFVASDRSSDVKFDFYDMHFNHLPLRQGYDNASIEIAKPKNFELMKGIAAKLSKDIPHVRIDLYEANDKVYFGEMTFYHFSGFMPFMPEKWDNILGSWLTLPNTGINA